MVLEEIITQRSYETRPSYDLVYEWEDILLSHLDVKFSYDKEIRNKNKWVRRIPFSRYLLTSKPAFMFQMIGMRSVSCNKKNIVPHIIDFFIKDPKELKRFYSRYSEAQAVLVSSKEAYDFLCNNKCPLPLHHLALSISDKYALTTESSFSKEYDLVLMGRQNPILENFLKTYISDHPDFVYVFRKQENGEFNYYTSKGKKIGNINTRKEYIDLMRKAKVGLYATPGIDGGEVRTNGFSQVTPRLLEYIACGCHVLARYTNNSDTDYYELNSICPSIDTYEDFAKRMDYCLNNPVDMKFYSDYLAKHYTTVRAKQLQEIIKDL